MVKFACYYINMTQKRHIVVPRVLCFVFYKDSVLLLEPRTEKDWHGHYEPPGGHIEKGESVIKCANKEIYEETGLKVKATKLVGVVHVSGFFGKEVMLFITRSQALSNKVKASHEGIPVWFKLDELKNIKMLEDTKPMLDKILKLKKGEVFVGTSEFDGKEKLLSFDIQIN